MDNLVHLCSHHHHLVHEGGYTVEAHKAPGKHTQFHFLDPNKNLISNEPIEAGQSSLDPVEKLHKLQAIGKTPVSYDTLWKYNGDTLDYDTALMNLFKTRDKAAAA